MAAVEIAMAATPPPSYDRSAIIQTFYAEREEQLQRCPRRLADFR